MKISSLREEVFENHRVISHPSQFDASTFSSINSNSDDIMYFPGRNILEEFVSTAKTYPNDYSNGVKSYGSIIRTASTASIVFVNCLITCICYGVLYNVNTNGFLDVERGILGQMLGGVIFAVFAGQPMVILATTTAMSIYIVIVRGFAVHADYPFSKFYSAVGVSASAILFLMSILGAPWFMKFARTSTEETMRVFQSTVRIYNALSAIYSAYKVFVHCWAGNDKGPMHINNLGSCTPTNTLIIFGLVLSATALGFFFNSLRESEYFLWNIRILISNYAIPLAILIPTFVVFFVIQRGHDIDHNPDLQFHWIEFYDLPAHAYSIAIPLGIPLAFVIFMDHILVTQNAENPTNQLTRHHRRHWDLTVLALINFLLSCFGLPWMTGAMPTTVLQVRALTKIYKDKVPKNKFARTYIGHLNPSTE